MSPKPVLVAPVALYKPLLVGGCLPVVKLAFSPGLPVANHAIGVFSVGCETGNPDMVLFRGRSLGDKIVCCIEDLDCGSPVGLGAGANRLVARTLESLQIAVVDQLCLSRVAADLEEESAPRD